MDETSTSTNEIRNEHIETADAAPSPSPARSAEKRKPKITRARSAATERTAEAGVASERGNAPAEDITAAIEAIEAAGTVEEPVGYFASVGEITVTSDTDELIAEPETFAAICTDIRRRVNDLEESLIRQTFEIADRMVAAKRQYEAETGTGHGKRNPSRVKSFVVATGEAIGRSPAFVQRILTLAQIDPESRSRLESLRQTPSQALLLDIARETDPTKRVAKLIDALSEPERKARTEERKRHGLGTQRVMHTARLGDGERVGLEGRRVFIEITSVKVPRAALERALAESAESGEVELKRAVGADLDKKRRHDLPEITDAIVTLVVG